MSQARQKILLVDDDQELRVAFYEVLTRAGYDVAVAENGRTGLDLLLKHQAALVVSDIEMPDVDGIAFLRQIKQQLPALPVVMMTDYGTIETAVASMKNGAFDYLLKPFSGEILLETVTRVLAAGGGPATGPEPSAAPARVIVGRDERFVRLLERAKSVASSKATVLILGESGTGKEVFARYIHEIGERRNGPFVALNCAALPEGLLESELFGHEKGAFTGAIVTKKGKFELADGGTLLLDEIGEIPLHLQAKLLRVLQEEEVDRLGGKSPHPIDVHVVATTNRDLQKAVADGEFRQDLFYRLNVIPLRLPPLRERRGDIPLLADCFIAKYCGQYGKKMKKLSAAALRKFMSYSWPGNVREMENLVERGVLLAGGDELAPMDFWDDEECAPTGEFEDENEIEMEAAGEGDSGDSPAAGNFIDSLTQAGGAMPKLRDVERQLILQSLARTDNNRTHAARMLGISVRTLRNKLHEYRTQGVLG